MPVAERRAWATRVIGALQPRLAGVDRVVMLAGARYREFLVEAIRANCISVDVPLQGLRIGEQLGWLKKALDYDSTR